MRASPRKKGRRAMLQISLTLAPDMRCPLTVYERRTAVEHPTYIQRINTYTPAAVMASAPAPLRLAANIQACSSHGAGASPALSAASGCGEWLAAQGELEQSGDAPGQQRIDDDGQHCGEIEHAAVGVRRGEDALERRDERVGDA